jgi:hypothetical protein
VGVFGSVVAYIIEAVRSSLISEAKNTHTTEGPKRV